jgi:hypothetical protein
LISVTSIPKINRTLFFFLPISSEDAELGDEERDDDLDHGVLDAADLVAGQASPATFSSQPQSSSGDQMAVVSHAVAASANVEAAVADSSTPSIADVAAVMAATAASGSGGAGTPTGSAKDEFSEMLLKAGFTDDSELKILSFLCLVVY